MIIVSIIAKGILYTIFAGWILSFIIGVSIIKGDNDVLSDWFKYIKLEFNEKDLFTKIQIIFLCITFIWTMYLGHIVFRVLYDALSYIADWMNKDE